MFLIVGLGNPGEKYDHTRHNVGFDVLALLSEKLRIPIDRVRNRALVGEGQFAGEKVALCKPQTYMNLSGEAVQALLCWYKLPPERLLVIYDDIDLAPGWLRIRRDGSAGTHNGMRSIICCIGTEAFPRIRVGIGGRPPQFELADWVLSHYHTPEEKQTALDAYMRAADAAVEWMRNGIQSAMTLYNTQKPKPPKPERPERARPAQGHVKAVTGSPAGQAIAADAANSAATADLADVPGSVTATDAAQSAAAADTANAAQSAAAADTANAAHSASAGDALPSAQAAASAPTPSALSDAGGSASLAPPACACVGAPLPSASSLSRKNGPCAVDPIPADPQESPHE
ncbi:MAG: aminoacyl-tRNA hydrolase [Clostridiales bacterium]|nr:aminoacyl-tRNA hydrolase [Clostridiales bacterium]